MNKLLLTVVLASAGLLAACDNGGAPPPAPTPPPPPPVVVPPPPASTGLSTVVQAAFQTTNETALPVNINALNIDPSDETPTLYNNLLI